MIGNERFDNIEDLFSKVIENNIKGDLIETGIWRGGAVIFMNAINKIYNQNRKIYVADSFEGLSPPDDSYPEDKDSELHTESEYIALLDNVKKNFEHYLI
tara:strand:+ start:848 stop:1147 length:300 start_codon:yes stop_codon:yes gene_type:complete